MYIRRTKPTTLDQGGGYYTYRMVEFTRFGDQVKQRTLLNSGKDLGIPEEKWPLLTKRIEQLIQLPSHKQLELFVLTDELEHSLESVAQYIALECYGNVLVVQAIVPTNQRHRLIRPIIIPWISIILRFLNRVVLA